MRIELPKDFVIADRYQVLGVLGTGGFAISYKCLDTLSAKVVAVKELAPQDSERLNNGYLKFADAPEVASRLAIQFIEEAKILSKLRIEGVVKTFDAFKSNGTAYCVMEFVEGSKTLAQILNEKHYLSVPETRIIVEHLCVSLTQVHEKGILHRDIKPSNILITKEGIPILIDFGAAREWELDKTQRHTTMITPGYSPIEQLSEVGRRGPASDIYSLCATAYHMLAGFAPPSAPDRIGGEPLKLFANVRSDVPNEIEEAIRYGLSIKASDRPQSALELKELFSIQYQSHDSVELTEIEKMDSTLDRLHFLKFTAKECPGCGSVLESPKPIRNGACPVCRDGKIVFRNLSFSNCASCKTGVLRRVHNLPFKFCPQCRLGELVSKGLIRKTFDCNLCGCQFQKNGSEYELTKPGNPKLQQSDLLRTLAESGHSFSSEFLLDYSTRSEWIRICDSCASQWDELDHQLLLVFDASDTLTDYKGKWVTEEEWARLSLSLPLDSGNAICESCQADYFCEEEFITLLDAERDAFGFLSQFQGRRLKIDSIPWIAIGKLSGNNGLLCRDCGTEFDNAGDYLRLVEAPGPPLSFWIGKPLMFEDWHRVARGLPQLAFQEQYLQDFKGVIKREILAGNIDWDSNRENQRWSSIARQVDPENKTNHLSGKGKLNLVDGILEFAVKFSKKQIPIDAIRSAESEKEFLTIVISGEREPLCFLIDPVELQVPLRSGTYDVELTAADLQSLLLQNQSPAVI